jgi:hypothetical protein
MQEFSFCLILNAMKSNQMKVLSASLLSIKMKEFNANTKEHEAKKIQTKGALKMLTRTQKM